MRIADMHVHSSVSFDCKFSKVDMSRAAYTNCVNTICFTDHYDIIDANGNKNSPYDWSEARIEQEAVYNVRPSNLEILYGLELGNAFFDYKFADEALVEEGLDFVLGSVHNSRIDSLCRDYSRLFYNESNIDTLLQDYFQCIIDIVNWGNFDSLAHLNYPLRYIRKTLKKDIPLSKYESVIVTILQLLIIKNIALEVNTRNFYANKPDYEYLLEQYYRLGGRLLTFGSDAHEPSKIGEGLLVAYKLASQKGFNNYALYRKRVPFMYHI